MGVIFFWSSQPALPITQRADASQLHLQAHLIAYGILGLLLALGVGTDRRGLAMALVVATLYGALDEVHQTFVPGRQGRAREVLVDAAAAAAALLAFAALRAGVRPVVVAQPVSENRGSRG